MSTNWSARQFSRGEDRKSIIVTLVSSLSSVDRGFRDLKSGDYWLRFHGPQSIFENPICYLLALGITRAHGAGKMYSTQDARSAILSRCFREAPEFPGNVRIWFTARRRKANEVRAEEASHRGGRSGSQDGVSRWIVGDRRRDQIA